MATCHNCGSCNAEYDCNGLKFCDWECFKEWDAEEQESLDRFAEEYKAFYIDGNRKGLRAAINLVAPQAEAKP